MTNDLPQGAGWTALLTAEARARESLRAEPLFIDPWAAPIVAYVREKYASATGLPPLDHHGETSSLWADMRHYVAVRTPFYDDFVRRGVRAGCRQVVLLGAGYDTRAHRLGLPAGTTVYEVDTAQMLAFKAAALAHHDFEGATSALRRPVATDLLGDWTTALVGAGFDASRPSAWTAEGLLQFLGRDECDRLLRRMTDLCAPGSRVAMEWFVPNDVAESVMKNLQRTTGTASAELLRTGPAGSPIHQLPPYGWNDLVVEYPSALFARAGRTTPAVFDTPTPGSVSIEFVTATRAATDEGRFPRS